MSLFSNTLQIILERLPGSRVAFADRTGIPNSTLHTYVHGAAVPDVEALEKICRGLEPADRAELVVAHLHDQTPASAQELVRIVSLVKEPKAADEPAAFKDIKLPKRVRDDFENLMRRAMNDKRVVEWIGGTVDLLEGRNA